jgi:hypothetical protein
LCHPDLLFWEIDLHPDEAPKIEMEYIFKNLIRRRLGKEKSLMETDKNDVFSSVCL